MNLFRSYRIILFLTLVGTGAIWSDLASQCVLDTSILVEAIDTVEFEIEIDGLLNNDLSDPAQGVCGVRLSFEHEYLGDIFVELISPGGQSVRLIGPEITSGFTQLTQWDVLFVPCGFPTSPDPGYSGQWSNDQSWGILNNFSGIYHPFLGCLEDFNTGPANGTWTIRIVDRSPFYGGEIKSITLIFCDPSGLDCAPCGADAGEWVYEDSILQICQFDDGLFLDTTVIFPGGTPDSTDYGYAWLLATPDTIDRVLEIPDLRSFPPGPYTICGLSYRRDEIALLPDSSDNMILDSLRSGLDSENAPFCGKLTNGCLRLDILPLPDTVFLADTVCEGDTYIWFGEEYDAAGIYQHVIEKGAGLCDSVFQLTLSTIDLRPVITGGDTINCLERELILNASSSDSLPGTLFTWYLNGDELPTLFNGRQVQVSESGTLILNLSLGQCDFSDTLIIAVDTLPPQASIAMDTLNCLSATGMVSVQNPQSGYSYEWFDNGVSSASGPIWTEASFGALVLRIQASNGCVSEISFRMPVDTLPLSVNIASDTITCSADQAVIRVNADRGIRSFGWAGPGLITTSQDSAIVERGGVYTYTAQGMNGCDTTVLVNVQEDLRLPEFSVSLDTLTCLRDTIVPVVVNNIPGSRFIWEGPSGNNTEGESPALTDTGFYNLKVITPTGCEKDTLLYLPGDLFVPVPSLIADTLGCHPDSIMIRVQIGQPDIFQYEWSGPGNFVSFQREPWIFLEGSYFLRTTADNGCSVTVPVEIARREEIPEITYQTAGIDCSDTLGRISVTSPTAISFEWSGPNNFTSQSALIDDLPAGQYSVTVTDAVGCSNTAIITILEDKSPPPIELFADTLTCLDTLANIRFESDQRLDAFFWRTPQGKTLLDSATNVSNPGDYSFFYRGTNGCEGVATLRVIADTLPPDTRIVEPVINCVDRQVALYLENYQNSGVVSWTGPGGQVITADTIQVTEGGEYTVRVLGANGCLFLDTAVISVDTALPDIRITGDTITCVSRSALIQVTPGTNVERWRVLGPGGDFMDMVNINIDMGGMYYLEWEGRNGCMGQDSVFIPVDTLGPDLELMAEQIDCRREDSLVLEVLGTHPGLSFQWNGPSGFNSRQEDTLTGTPGMYYLSSIDQKGCMSRDSVFIGFDTIPPRFRINPIDTLNCANDSVNILVNRSSGTIRLAFDAPAGILVNDSVWRTSEPGWHYILAEGSNACIYIDSVEVFESSYRPTVTATGPNLNCRDTSGILIALADTVGGAFRWTGPDGFISSDPMPVIDRPGQYFVRYILPNGCEGEDSVTVSLDLSGPEILLTGDSITCDHPEAIVQVRSPDSLYAIEWEGPGGIVSSMATIRVRQEGWYRVLVEDSVSCITLDSIYVLSDTLSPVVEIEQQGALGCRSGTVQLEVSISSGTPNMSWYWLDPSGLLFGSNEEIVTVDSQGIYSVVVVNNSNGCETRVEVSVEAGNANALEAIWISVPPVCPGESSGKFVLEAISGHTGFFSVTLNGTDLGMTDSIEGLSSGQYTIQIQDSLGCEWIGQLLLPPADTFWVDLGPDRSIELGETLTLSPVFNQGASGVFTLSWSPPNNNCPSCLQRTVSPASDTRYEILVSDDRGCEARDDVWVRVRASSRVFLPNSFTPNGDGVNDAWTISVGEDVDQLLELQIFDRWGGLVHSLQGLSLFDGMELWDGTMGGRVLNPAVFVYRLVYTSSSGNRYVAYGDITLLQ